MGAKGRRKGGREDGGCSRRRRKSLLIPDLLPPSKLSEISFPPSMSSINASNGRKLSGLRPRNGSKAFYPPRTNYNIQVEALKMKRDKSDFEK